MESAIAYVPLPKVTAPGAVVLREPAYKLFIPAVGEFEVLESANAWWMDKQKVTALFDAYKAGATDIAACINAKISIGQLRYFKDAHPGFLHAKEACKEVPQLGFLNTLNTKGKEDLPTVRWYLGKRHSDFKPTVDDERTFTPTVNVGVQVNNNFDEDKLEEEIGREGDAFVPEAPAESEGRGGEVLAQEMQG